MGKTLLFNLLLSLSQSFHSGVHPKTFDGVCRLEQIPSSCQGQVDLIPSTLGKYDRFIPACPSHLLTLSLKEQACSGQAKFESFLSQGQFKALDYLLWLSLLLNQMCFFCSSRGC